MPKDAKKRDYSKTVIYQIECKNPNITKTYGGHSTNLIKRRQHHKDHCNNTQDPKHNFYVYQFIRANGGWENWQVVWQYNYPCKNIDEAKLEERHFIKNNSCELNSNIPIILEEEKKDYQKDYQKEYRAKKKEDETEDEKNKRLAKERQYRAKKKAEETEEEEKERLEKARKKYKEKYSEKNKVENLTEEQKAKKKEKNRLYREKQKLLKQNKLVVI